MEKRRNRGGVRDVALLRLQVIFWLIAVAIQSVNNISQEVSVLYTDTDAAFFKRSDDKIVETLAPDQLNYNAACCPVSGN